MAYERWVYINGNWGDIIVQLQHCCQKYPIFNILLSAWGNHDEQRRILEFLNSQLFIGKVVMGMPYQYYHNNDHTLDFNKLQETCAYHNVQDLDMSYSIGGSRPSGFNILPPILNPIRLTLPYMYTTKQYNIDNLSQYILINPYSFASTAKNTHWRYWENLLHYLFEGTIYKYIIVGMSINKNDQYLKEEIPLEESAYQYKNVINLINNRQLVESNCDIFSLSNQVAYTITTSNSLAHWCINQNTPSMIIGNAYVNAMPWSNIFNKHTPNNVTFYPHTTNVISIVYDLLNNRLKHHVKQY